MHTAGNQRAAMQRMRHCDVKKSRLMRLRTSGKFSSFIQQSETYTIILQIGIEICTKLFTKHVGLSTENKR